MVRVRIFALILVMVAAAALPAAPPTPYALQVLGSAWNDDNNTPWAHHGVTAELTYKDTSNITHILYVTGTTDANGEIVINCNLTNPDLTKGITGLVYPTDLDNWHAVSMANGAETPITHTLTMNLLEVKHK